MSSEARERLGSQQAALLEALVGLAPLPADFDALRIRACGEALLNKRARAAARAWPTLERFLGEGPFRDRFLDFVRRTPLPSEGGPLADGQGFARGLARLSDEARLELLAVELHYRHTRDGLVPRRGPVLKIAWLRTAGRVVIALKLPWLGVRSVSLRWPFAS